MTSKMVCGEVDTSPSQPVAPLCRRAALRHDGTATKPMEADTIAIERLQQEAVDSSPAGDRMDLAEAAWRPCGLWPKQRAQANAKEARRITARKQPKDIASTHNAQHCRNTSPSRTLKS